ncbi:DMT family transporter [Proteus mirabilis]|uniref:DMT family transporter n=1 Tax=Proteus mirabilis TaxID=584 RepID=UPI000F5CF615|nr:DMT family transporter [Proteus mirabilis]AZG98560.1 EamA-like transporter family protein [Proteus mirabilis]MCI9766236.1 DMT family transporter [Proteus mirabilis]MCI9769823.1 DMT family transporter [Proteus mirabilis]MCI9773417.1 DMT family transporter [Proteus mirabilis]HBC8711503.1 DMT family transporter [Proteus mirabilis]
MNNKYILSLIALSSGVLLSLMIMSNSYLASFTTPLTASWITHGIGTLFSLIIYILYSSKNPLKKQSKNKIKLQWYLGGIPGAFTVLLAAMTVNSPLSLSSSIILMITGQIIFSVIVDAMGWFGVKKRRITLVDLWMCFLLILGSALLIIGR